jgi:hypothetical protein
MEEKDWEGIKERLKIWLFGEYKFKNRWKILMWGIQMACALILFYYVIISTEFRVGKECAEAQPLIQGVKNGTLICMDTDYYRMGFRNLSNSPIGFNFTPLSNYS